MKQRASVFMLQYSLCKPSEKILGTNMKVIMFKNKESISNLTSF